jgi:uncharacterized oxidoreductase
MPLGAFIEQAVAFVGTDDEEILVGDARAMRANPGPNEHGLIEDFNKQMLALFST